MFDLITDIHEILTSHNVPNKDQLFDELSQSVFQYYEQEQEEIYKIHQTYYRVLNEIVTDGE